MDSCAWLSPVVGDGVPPLDEPASPSPTLMPSNVDSNAEASSHVKRSSRNKSVLGDGEGRSCLMAVFRRRVGAQSTGGDG
jgi:hypothetical protein